MSTVLLSKREGSKEWGLRQKFSEANYELDNSKMTQERFERYCQIQINKWIDCEPTTQFKIVVGWESTTFKGWGSSKVNLKLAA